jgi:hypothetical protein
MMPQSSRRERDRSTDKSVTGALLFILNSPLTNQFRGRTYAELIAITLVRLAVDGDIHAIKEIADRTEGRVQQARVEERGVEISYVSDTEALVRDSEVLDRLRREFFEASPNYKTK